MALKGDLLSSDLSTVFQMMAMNRKRGRLVVQDQGNLINLRRLYIAEDRVALLDPPPPRPLEGFLVQTGVVNYDQARKARNSSSRLRQSALKVLRNQGLITEEDEAHATRVLEEEEILEIFLWRNVSFSLEEGGEPPEEARFYHVDHLVMEAARRQDEWAHVVEGNGGLHAIYTPLRTAGESGAFQPEEVQCMVLDHVDGIRGTREIMEATGLSRYFVDVSLRALEEAGYVAPLGLADLVSSGDRLLAEGDVESGIRLFMGALRFDRRNVTIHKRLAGAYLQVGRISKAAAHYRYCAHSRLAGGHRREAITIYQHVLKLLPTDFRTLKRCAALLAEEGEVLGPDDQQTLSQARRLMNYCLDVGQNHEALSVVDSLLSIDSSDEALLETQARLRLRTGRKEDAVEAYLALAQERRNRGDLSGALEIYRMMVGLDTPGRHIYQVKIQEIQKLLESGRRRARRGKAVLMLLVGALVAGGLFWLYARRAEKAFEALPVENPTTVQAAMALAKRYRELAKVHPLTPAARKAEAQAAEFEGIAGRIREARRRAVEEAAEARRQAARLAQGKAREALGWMRSGRLDKAVTAYHEALEVGQAAGSVWEERGAAEKRLGDLEAYLKEGRALLAAGREALERGDRRGAFEAFVKAGGEYRLLPDLDDVRVPLRITAAPPDAWISLDGGGPSARGVLETELALKGSTRVVVRAPGHQGREINMQLPPAAWEIPVVLERQPVAWVETEEPLVGLARLDGSLVAGVARNGRLVAVDVERGRVVFRSLPDTISTTSHPPVSIPSGVVVGSETGGIQLLRLTDGAVVWVEEALPEGERLHRLLPHEDRIVVVGVEGSVALLDAEGETLWRRSLGGRPLSACLNGGQVAVLLESGDLRCLRLKDGAPGNEHTGSFSGALAGHKDGRLVTWKPGRGVLLLDPGGAEAARLLAVGRGVTAGPVVSAGRVLVAVGNRLLVTDEAGGQESLTLPEPAGAIIPGSGGRAAVRLASGRLLVVDVEAPQMLFAYEGPEGTPAAPLFLPQGMVTAHQNGRLVLLELP